MDTVTLLFWASVAWLAYAYALYPAFMAALSLGGAAPSRRGSFEPRVSLIVSAHNEEAVIGGKIENTLGLDYPEGGLDVIVASDGSTDGTDGIVRGYGGRVTLYSGRRMGKSAMLNLVAPNASGDVLVFSDADSVYDKDALKRLVSLFADPAVGCVSGSVRYVDRSGARVEGLYQRFEDAVKGYESSVSSILGANGGIYALRRELYRPIPPEYLNDAYHPPQVVSMGYRAVYVKDAFATEPFDNGIVEEYRRKVRIVLPALSQMGFVLGLWRRPFYVFMYASHKLLRWFGFVPLAVALASNMILAGGAPYGAILALQSLFYLVAAAGLVASAGGLRLPVFSAPAYFVMVNLAAFTAFVKYAVGHRVATW